ncbi:MAG: hypothetical protein IJX94_01245 [Clostridia bacterium]|nr:hypothetical protein [Clostridia bacterium]
MARYISANELTALIQEKLNENQELKGTFGYYAVETFKEILEKAPAADVVPVVRCKDCRNCELIYPEKKIGEEPVVVYYCEAIKGSRTPTDFCSYGVKKE